MRIKTITFILLFMVTTFLLTACADGDRSESQHSDSGSERHNGPDVDPVISNLPELSSFEGQKTDKFLVDLEYVTRGHPFLGEGSENPDDGAHVNFDNSGNRWPEGTAVTDYPPVYAVADGYIEMVDFYDTVGPNSKYGVYLAFAQKNGRPVKFHMSIEPSSNPGDESFYLPYILVEKGQTVSKGDILAYMYVGPYHEDSGPHIHFSVQPEGEHQQAPAIFTDEIVRAFHARWGSIDGDGDMPVCMGYKLSKKENPFSDEALECLK
jgi:murein DD-endopeptidase MepM/ murein hydrolase activator NlpD